jgi:hypothetical protein
MGGLKMSDSIKTILKGVILVLSIITVLMSFGLVKLATP